MSVNWNFFQLIAPYKTRATRLYALISLDDNIIPRIYQGGLSSLNPGKIIHIFISRDDLLYTAGFVKTVPDVYTLLMNTIYLSRCTQIAYGTDFRKNKVA